ncbi:LPXTG-motif cell wall anchor domain-containing protein [Streptococcus pseudopneumoniae]|nr:LPXTG-motif cell wall anchor domain-containing protein [Streptococcus pseudopneumoniae]
MATKLNALPETVENEKKLANIEQVGDTKNINQGEVRELDEFGGWKAIDGGKFGVARKTDSGVFPIETVNTVRTDRRGKDQTWLNESSFDRSKDYALFLGLVRTKATENEEVDDGSVYTQNKEFSNKGKGVKNFKGIEKTFKNYSPSTGSDVTVSFYTGITGDIDGNKAGYKVEVVTKTAEGTINTIYSQSFYPQYSSDDEYKKVEKLTLNSDAHLDTTRSTMESQKTELTMKLGEEPNKKKLGTSHGTFTSKNISLLPGVTEYTVRIRAADNTKLGMGFQVPWKQYALPVVGNGFAVTQDTSKVAKDLAQKVYDKLIEQKEKDTKWSTSETKAAYEAKLQEIKEKIDSGGNTSDYKTVVEEALKKQKTLNEELKIKRKAADEIAEKAAEKLVMIDDDDTLSENEKDAAKEEVIEDAKKAANNVAVATDQGGVENAKMEGIAEITKVNPVGRDKAKKALDKAAETEKAEINADPSLTAKEKEQKVKDLEAKLTEEKGKIDTAADADAVAKAKTAGETAIAGVHTNGDLEALKKAAKADLDKAAQAEKAAIAADKSLTAAQRAEKEQAVDAAKAAAEAKIDSAADADKVAEAKTAGETAIAGVHTNGDLEALKKAAKADLAKKLADKLAAIDNTPNATKEEKDAAKNRAKQAANQAIQAIDAASDQAGVDKAQADGIAAIAAVNPVAKDKAKAAALPNTGSRSDSTTAALGLLSIFGAVGLLFSKKKKDDEEA